MSNVAKPIALEIAEFVAGLRHDRLPGSTVRAVKHLLLDSLGCALGALEAAPARLIAPAVPADGGATVIGHGRRSSAEGAAMVNGTLLRYLDFMDVYWAKDVCHPSENIPPALACVEEAGGGGRELIAAILAGYEVQLRLCDAFSFMDRGFHHVSAAGFVVPFIAGKAWRQPAEAMAHGSVLGGARHLTLLALSRGRLSMAKAVGYAMNGAESITMARLAGAGMTGPLSTYEWLFRMPGSEVLPLALDYDSFGIERVSLKQFPVQFNLQAPVVAAIRLHQALRGRIGDIDRVAVMVKQETLGRTADAAKFAPSDRETADHSLPACVAMALLDGTVTVAQFEAGRYRDADVVALIGKIEAMAGADFEARFPHGRPGEVRVTLADGSRHEALEETAFGDPERPFDDAALHAKFLGLAEPVLGRDRAWRVVELVDALETLPELAPLTGILSQNG